MTNTMKPLILAVALIVATAANASAQWTTTPDIYGGGWTTRGPSGTYSTTPDIYGGGYTTRRGY